MNDWAFIKAAIESAVKEREALLDKLNELPMIQDRLNKLLVFIQLGEKLLLSKITQEV